MSNTADQLRDEMNRDENFRRLAQTLADALEAHPLASPDYDARLLAQEWSELYQRGNVTYREGDTAPLVWCTTTSVEVIHAWGQPTLVEAMLNTLKPTDTVRHVSSKPRIALAGVPVKNYTAIIDRGD